MVGKTGSKIRRLSGILCLVTLFLCISCEERVPNESGYGVVPMSFCGDVSETKAVKEYASVGDLTDFGVFSYLTQGEFDPTTAIPNFMYNQYVEKRANGGWLYAPVKYWPTDITKKISFFAYAPYVKSATSGNSNPSFQNESANGFPTLDYTVPTASENHVDLLVSRPLMNRTFKDDNGRVSFNMNHALTKVSVYVKSDDDTAGKKVKDFTLSGAKRGTLNFYAPVSADDKGFEWTFPTPAETEVFTTNVDKFPVLGSTPGEKQLLSTFYLLPVNTGGVFDITYTYEATSSDGTLLIQTISLTDQPLTSTDKWKEGASMSYIIGISKKKITVTEVTSPEWSEGGKETVEGTVS